MIRTVESKCPMSLRPLREMNAQHAVVKPLSSLFHKEPVPEGRFDIVTTNRPSVRKVKYPSAFQEIARGDFVSHYRDAVTAVVEPFDVQPNRLISAGMSRK